MVKVVIFDFGGVIAEEGFREGLLAIANSNGIDPEYFLTKAEELIFKTGYITGKADESHYWDVLRKETKIKQSDKELESPKFSNIFRIGKYTSQRQKTCPFPRHSLFFGIKTISWVIHRFNHLLDYCSFPGRRHTC